MMTENSPLEVPDKADLPVAPEELRLVMRQWTTGVTVVTARSAGEQHGMTVSSFTSISLDPPLVSISLAHNARAHRLVVSTGRFAVTILSAEQQDLSERFAGRIPDAEDRFEGLNCFELVSGAPLIPGGLAWLDCRVAAQLEAGNNTVFLGEVLAVKNGPGGSPLLYYDRDYQQLCD